MDSPSSDKESRGTSKKARSDYQHPIPTASVSLKLLAQTGLSSGGEGSPSSTRVLTSSKGSLLRTSATPPSGGGSPLGTPVHTSPKGTLLRTSATPPSGGGSPLGTPGRTSPKGTLLRTSGTPPSGGGSPLGTPVRTSPKGTLLRTSATPPSGGGSPLSTPSPSIPGVKHFNRALMEIKQSPSQTAMEHISSAIGKIRRRTKTDRDPKLLALLTSSESLYQSLNADIKAQRGEVNNLMPTISAVEEFLSASVDLTFLLFHEIEGLKRELEDLKQENQEFKKLSLVTEWIRAYQRIVALQCSGKRYHILKSDLDSEAFLEDRWNEGEYHSELLEVLKKHGSSGAKWDMISSIRTYRNKKFHHNWSITSSNVLQYEQRDLEELKKLTLPKEQQEDLIDMMEFVQKYLLAQRSGTAQSSKAE